MADLEICGDVFNCQNAWGSSTHIYWVEIRNASCPEMGKRVLHTKSCPASAMTWECPTEHSQRQTKPVYNFLSLENNHFTRITKCFLYGFKKYRYQFNRSYSLQESVCVYWETFLICFFGGFSKSCYCPGNDVPTACSSQNLSC